MNLQDSVVLITGASSGIGEKAAHLCAERKARLVLAARSTESLEALAHQITSSGGSAIAVPTDVTEREQVQALVERALAEYGQVDALVNNAGFGVFDSIKKARFEDLDDMMQVNLYGAVHCIQTLLPHMLERGRGQIVNVASMSGLVATQNQAFYNATKFALVGMSRALQLDLHRTGVKCAIVCPGPVRTPFFTRADKEKLVRASRYMPWLNAEDVAWKIVEAIANDSSGEIVLPARMYPLISLSGAFPAISRFLLRLMG